MKNVLTALACLISVSLFGQTSILDDKNGFRDIKFGTSVSDYSFIIKCDSHWGCDDYYFSRDGALGDKLWNQRHRSHPATHYVDIAKSGYNKLLVSPINRIYIEADENDIIIKIRLVLETDADVYLILYDVFGLETITPMWEAYQKSRGGVWKIWRGEVVSMQLESVHLDGDSRGKRIIGYELSFENRGLIKNREEKQQMDRNNKKQEAIDTQF